jgi:hypothetical protein
MAIGIVDVCPSKIVDLSIVMLVYQRVNVSNSWFHGNQIRFNNWQCVEKTSPVLSPQLKRLGLQGHQQDNTSVSLCFHK